MLFKNIKSYILEEDFKFIFSNNKIDVINYTSIPHFDSEKIIVTNETNDIIIKGKNLVISKLLNKEIMIEGKIQNIEFR